MSRFTADNEVLAREILSRYPVAKSALIPLLHLSQEQNGYITQDAMRHIAELLDVTPAEVYGTATFYEMFRFQPTHRPCLSRLRPMISSGSRPKALPYTRGGPAPTNRRNCTCTRKAATASECASRTSLQIIGLTGLLIGWSCKAG